jgi:hypothetical protein
MIIDSNQNSTFQENMNMTQSNKNQREQVKLRTISLFLLIDRIMFRQMRSKCPNFNERSNNSHEYLGHQKVYQTKYKMKDTDSIISTYSDRFTTQSVGRRIPTSHVLGKTQGVLTEGKSKMIIRFWNSCNIHWEFLPQSPGTTAG